MVDETDGQVSPGEIHTDTFPMSRSIQTYIRLYIGKVGSAYIHTYIHPPRITYTCTSIHPSIHPHPQRLSPSNIPNYRSMRPASDRSPGAPALPSSGLSVASSGQ